MNQAMTDEEIRELCTVTRHGPLPEDTVRRLINGALRLMDEKQSQRIAMEQAALSTRFRLYCGDVYYPGGGDVDFVCAYQTKEDATRAAIELHLRGHELTGGDSWVSVFDTFTGLSFDPGGKVCDRLEAGHCNLEWSKKKLREKRMMGNVVTVGFPFPER